MVLTREKPDIRKIRCPQCRSKYLRITDYIHKSDEPFCIARIECHRHDEGEDIYISVIFGDWDDERAFADHVTFTCRFGFVEGHEERVCSLIQNESDETVLGRRLTREEALQHPLINTFWEVIDFILTTNKPMLDFIRDSSLSPAHRLLHKILPNNMLGDYKVASFWAWFTVNEERYFHFENNQDELFASLNSHLKKIDQNLTFEFGPVTNSKREFILSCEGIASSAKSVLALTSADPALPRWRVIAFRQRRKTDWVEMDSKRLLLKDIHFTYAFNQNNLIDVKLYLKGYSETTHGSLMFLALDTLLGEYDVMTRLGNIEFMRPPSTSVPDLMALPELVKLVDSRKS